MDFGRLWELVVDKVAWHVTVHGVSKSWTRLSDWTELNYGEDQNLSLPDFRAVKTNKQTNKKTSLYIWRSEGFSAGSKC